MSGASATTTANNNNIFNLDVQALANQALTQFFSQVGQTMNNNPITTTFEVPCGNFCSIVCNITVKPIGILASSSTTAATPAALTGFTS